MSYRRSFFRNKVAFILKYILQPFSPIINNFFNESRDDSPSLILSPKDCACARVFVREVILKKGVKWKVGDGRNAQFWKMTDLD